MHRENTSVASAHAAEEKAVERDATLVAAATPKSVAFAVDASDVCNAPHGASQDESAESDVAGGATADQTRVTGVAADNSAVRQRATVTRKPPAGLHQFLADGEFTDSVKNVAAMLIDEPHLRQTGLLHDRVTVSVTQPVRLVWS